MTEEHSVLITGASGFLGSCLAENLSQQGFTLIGIDINPPQRPGLWSQFFVGRCEALNFDAVFATHVIDVVIHLAGGSSVAVSEREPFQDFANLVPGTVNLITSIARCSPSTRFIFFSSAAVYGNAASLPITEAAELMPISPYGIHKAAAECLLEHYARLFDISIVVLRVFSAYGPGLRKQLLWDLCQKALAAVAQEKTSIELSGTGKESRDFVHARDVAQAVRVVISAKNPGKVTVFNVGSGVETSIFEIAKYVVDALGAKLRIDFSGRRRGSDPVNWRSDISKLNRIGYQPKIAIRDGIASVAEWARQQGVVPPLS